MENTYLTHITTYNNNHYNQNILNVQLNKIDYAFITYF